MAFVANVSAKDYVISNLGKAEDFTAGTYSYNGADVAMRSGAWLAETGEKFAVVLKQEDNINNSLTDEGNIANIHKSETELRVYKDFRLDITAPEGVSMKNVVIFSTGGRYANFTATPAGTVTVSDADKTMTWSYADGSNTLSILADVAQIRISKVVVSDEAGTVVEPEPEPGVNTGAGTEEIPYTVADIIAKGTEASETGVYVKGYIVGYANGSIDKPVFSAADCTVATNILLADAADCNDVAACVPVQLPKGDVRTALNLQDNPGNLGREVTLTGDIAKYFNVPGFKNTSAYVLGEGGSTPDVPDTPEGPVAFLDENFASNIPSTWTQVNVSGDKEWYQTSYNGVGYAAMTGYKGTQPPFDQWLVSPAIDMSKVNNKTLTFRTQVNGYGSTTSVFEAYVMTSADTKGENTKLDATIATAPASGYSEWVESGSLDMSTFTGVVYVAFRFYATEDVNYATWCVTDVKLGTATETPDDPEKPEVKTVANVAEFISMASDEKPVYAINNAVTVVYQNGSYLYVTDETAALLVYGYDLPKYAAGDVIPAGITGAAQIYNEFAQLSSPVLDTFKAATESLTPPAPKAITCEELAADLIHNYVLIENVTISGEGRNFTMVDNTGAEVTLYNQFNDATKYDPAVEVPTGEGFNVYGFVGAYKGNLQVYPVNIVSNSGVEGIELENAPVVYYNLQGVKVANPENGIYVRVQGGNATKVVIR